MLHAEYDWTPTTMTMRVDITKEEHELLMAVRQLRDAEATNDDTQSALMKAREDAEDSEWELNDAQADYDMALDRVKMAMAVDDATEAQAGIVDTLRLPERDDLWKTLGETNPYKTGAIRYITSH